MTRFRPALSGAAVLAAALLLVGCAQAAPAAESGAEGAPVTGGTLVYLEQQAHTGLYPPTAGFYPNGGIVNNITDRLVFQDPETLEFEPWVASEWESNADATEITFTIRDGVTFSDGSALDAAVVAKNFDLFGRGDAERALPASEAINNYERSEVLDEHTVRFFFSAPAPGFLQAASTINSGLLSSATLDFGLEEFGPGNAAKVIGSGPFTVDSEQIGTSLELRAREDYAWAPASWENQGRPYLDAVQITVTPEDSVRVGALTSGQAGLIRQLGAQDEARVQEAGFTVLAPQTNGVNNGLNLRFRNEILSDIRVRQALAAGIDRQEVVDTIFTEHYPLATSVLSSGALGYRDAGDALDFDPKRAARLLDEAGWAPGADGIRAKDGTPLRLVVNEALPQPRSFEAMTLVSQQLRKIGVDLSILRTDSGTAAEAQLDPDQVQIYHSMVGRADLDVIKSQYAGENRNVLLNRDRDGVIADPELETLLDRVAGTADPEARIAASGAVQDYLLDQAYVIPLFEEPQVYAAAPEVHGFGTESVARPSFAGVWLER